MPAYRLSNVQTRYPHAANPPVLDKVIFTLDHIHAGDHHVASTYEVVKYLTDHRIPVTVFIQCTNPSNNYAFDRNNAQLIYDLDRQLVTLGVHPKPAGHSQQEQTEQVQIINGIIRDVTGRSTNIMSYHGHRAGPEPGIRFPGMKYARGIINYWAVGTDNPLNTPVIPFNSVTRAFEEVHTRSEAGLSSTIFVHSQELSNGSTKKRVFDSFIKEVVQRRLQAVSYYQGMQGDFRRGGSGSSSGGGSSTGGSSSGSSSSSSVSNAATGVLRLSALKMPQQSPVRANFSLQNLGSGGGTYRANNVKTEQFRLPVGRYKVTAKIGNVSASETINLTAAGGIHHIFRLAV
ncbi:MAG TPA: hypothetical protein EYG68_03475 [Leucothrix mucor]|nr:hypothetical protein [Leucothrix mucor]